MEVYFLLIFSCVIFSLIYDYINQRLVKNILALVLFIVLVSVPALRNVTVGSDSRMYAEFLTYNYSILEWVNQGIEIGDGAIYWLISNLFGQQYFYLFLFYALIINFLFLYTIIKLEKKITIAIVILLLYGGMYFVQLNNLRQTMAVAWFMLAIVYLIEEKYIKTYIILVVAILFHYSAAFCLFIPVAYYLMKKRYWMVYFTSVISFFLLSVASLYIASFVSGFDALEKFSRYSVDADNSSGQKIFIVNLVFFVLTFIVVNFKGLIKDKLAAMSFYLCSITLVIQFCVAFLGLSSLGLGRLYQYFIIGYVFYFPYVMKQITPEKRPFLSWSVFSFLLIYIFFYMVVYNNGKYIPYVMNDDFSINIF
ncbi:EpsG family protein [Klebsiella quasipneumoniae]|uniref:EpsG family protein n=1 Tax=Klebsiella quasipneumoniae TaxID=1463165 RepID=UPI003CF8A3FB